MTNNAEHTPGPWSLTRTPKGHRMRVSGFGWGHFAKVVVRMDGEDEDQSEGIANANLIAAAPDLLEALNELVVARNSGKQPSVRMWDKAKTAIAKATGLSA